MISRLIKQTAEILAEIKAGDIIGFYAAIWSIIFVGAIAILFQKNVWAGVILALLSPIPVLVLTVVTKIILNRFIKELDIDGENKDTPILRIFDYGNEDKFLATVVSAPYGWSGSDSDVGRFTDVEVKVKDKDNYDTLYIDVFNNPAKTSGVPTAIDVWSSVEWYNIDENMLLLQHHGRWFISNPNKEKDKRKLLFRDIPSNGAPQRLHFAIKDKSEKYFYGWCRDENDKNPIRDFRLKLTDEQYIVKIILKGTNVFQEFKYRVERKNAKLSIMEALTNESSLIISTASKTAKPNGNLNISSVSSIPKQTATSEPSTILDKFSINLEKIKKDGIKKGWKITGLGLAFLDEIKSAPPFLGLRYEKPIISLSDEQILTEFFLASIYMEKYRNVIKGGRYIIRKDEDRKTIAKNTYGNERYEVYVPDYHTYPMGSILELPYINLETPDGPEFVKRKMDISKDIEKIKSLLESYHLVRDEAIPLLRIVYDTAERTLQERTS